MQVLNTFRIYLSEVRNVTTFSCKPFLRTNLDFALQHQKHVLSLPNLNDSNLPWFFIWYDFDEGTLTFLKPNQTIQIENQDEIKGSSGWTLLFHPDLIRKSELGKSIEDYSFFNYDLNEALHLSENERNSITDLVLKIEEEYNQNIDKHSQELIIANIEMLLKYSKRFYDRQFFTRTNLNKDLLSDFNKVVRTYYKSENPIQSGVLSVKECAEKLNLSVNYFGDLIKSETGRSAKDHINDYVIEKAKTLLLGSNESVSQIAYSLGFEYPQGLNKLFKAKVGISPSEYRNLNWIKTKPSA